MQVEFEDQVVQVDIDKRRGTIIGSSEHLSVLDKVELCEKAWRLWINDSFWLNPITKVFDDGTMRSLATLKDGTEGLMISYSSGGVTPGDSYFWILNENYRPVAWKFWVSIIPIGGLRFTWDEWIQLSTGAWISTYHDGIIGIRIADARGKATLEELTGVNDLFQPLLDAENLIAY